MPCKLETPDQRVNFLFDAAVRNIILHAPGEVYPGPYTYKRFWFRDAAFILHALLVTNQIERVRRAIDRFPQLQTSLGYFHSQDGEWDSNGAAIWLVNRYRELSGLSLDDKLVEAVARGAEWILKKRLSDSLEQPHAGLLPAGFSAEHLGPNDYYYWDDFWSAAGLRAAAAIARSVSQYSKRVPAWVDGADHLLAAIARSLQQTESRRDHPGIPASPYRRMDAGAVGSLVGSYPLQLVDPDDEPTLATTDFLLQNCLVQGGFFQDMIHSGINAYLTLHLAQVLLRSGRDGRQRYVELLRTVRDLASPTGQWPEAIHPQTLGGCMGDGQHIWAAAEWVLMLRNMFVREEGASLVLCSGIPGDWLAHPHLRFGPTATPFGPLSVQLFHHGSDYRVTWEADWRHRPEVMLVALPRHDPIPVDPTSGKIDIPSPLRVTK